MRHPWPCTREAKAHCSFKKGYHVVCHGEFYFSAGYTKCKESNGYTVMYQKTDTQDDYFGQIPYFVVVQPSKQLFAVIHPFTRDLDHERFCHFIPIKPVEGMLEARTISSGVGFLSI